MILHFGASEVAHEIAELEPVEPRPVVDHRLELVRGETEPGHPGIHLEDRRERPAAGARKAAPAVHLGEAVEHGDEAVRQELRLRTHGWTMQHVKLGPLREMRAQRQRLVQMGHEEMDAAFCGQRRGHAGRPQPVGIRLDHGGAARFPEPALQEAIIGADGGEVDGEECTRVLWTL